VFEPSPRCAEVDAARDGLNNHGVDLSEVPAAKRPSGSQTRRRSYVSWAFFIDPATMAGCC